MPLRLPSWSVPFGLPPIFEMNLPEGVLRERLRLAFAKATGTFDEFDLLSIVGRSQVGRIRYTGERERLQEDVPFQSVDEILERKRGGDLFRYLLEKFAAFSGITGVQPKILVRDERACAEMENKGSRLSQSYRGATHIVKLWEPNEFPQLAANEYFCLTAARKCGLAVPPCRLAEDGMALVIDRFDLRLDGTHRGFEDFCPQRAPDRRKVSRQLRNLSPETVRAVRELQAHQWGFGEALHPHCAELRASQRRRPSEEFRHGIRRRSG
jgi:serine/threonine-protein kinase HipA